MGWQRHKLRESDVWARVDGTGALVQDGEGRVEIVYKAAPGAKVYRAGARNLVAVPGEAAVEIQVGEPTPASTKKDAGKVPENAIHVWTDGACSGNPGPAGLGVVIVGDGPQREISEYLGEATNNIAELTAILRGLEAVPPEARKDRPVAVYSDSAYSIGLLTQNWKAKANVELVGELRALTKQFKDLRFIKVLGHSGIPLNERTDQLATSAVARRR